MDQGWQSSQWSWQYDNSLLWHTWHLTVATRSLSVLCFFVFFFLSWNCIVKPLSKTSCIVIVLLLNGTVTVLHVSMYSELLFLTSARVDESKLWRWGGWLVKVRKTKPGHVWVKHNDTNLELSSIITAVLPPEVAADLNWEVGD